ncbi:adhesion G-protein coupled receptor G6-like isoform X2 [Scomber scombrus]|uniref:Adhesion G-protein coupled receptor G6-like isoform X2 n=1 Tax=Scomber scombrus TaxID=13677 RepID=A0AAV1PVP0_SCOSC
MIMQSSILQNVGNGNKPAVSTGDGGRGLGNIRGCDHNKIFVVADSFGGLLRPGSHQQVDNCIIFVKNTTERTWGKRWPVINMPYLFFSKWHINKELHLYVLCGKKCKATVSSLPGPADTSTESDDTTSEETTEGGPCFVTLLDIKTRCKKPIYNEHFCNMEIPNRPVKQKYFINLNKTQDCFTCDNPVKKPEATIALDTEIKVNEEGKLDPAQAVEFIKDMARYAATINVSSATLSTSDGSAGVLIKMTEPEDVDEVSFGYASSNDSLNIIDNTDYLSTFSRSVTVSKEALEKVDLNMTEKFVTVFRFLNLEEDEKNSTILGNEVLAVEIGAHVANLTDKISVNVRNTTYKGIPSCQSWNGEGSRPNWTDDGCETQYGEDNITCRCSHLTFFAILLTPLNETISSYDLKSLTIITQIGCGLSMFFLAIVLFMYFLLRKAKASKATRIFIHLVVAMFLLNLTFLVNNHVAKLKNSIGCKIMAAVMHYFMLATFTWFAVQAFHIFLQLYRGGNISIHRYVLKVSIVGWVLPSVVVIVLFSIGKYGEQAIYTDDPENIEAMCVMTTFTQTLLHSVDYIKNDTTEPCLISVYLSVPRCWITDNDIHYIVNIGYYALVFLFTFLTFIIILTWLFCLRRIKAGNAETSKNGTSMVIIMGLCCILGITWGFAFFAYGVLRIPSYYIFTTLNSFQGFFLFIYYYKTGHLVDINGGVGKDSTSSTTTLKTAINTSLNPYKEPDKK